MADSRRNPHVSLGVAVAGAIFIADQITKYLILYGLELVPGERLIVAPFVDLVLTFNRGISYGLFPQDGELGRWFLVAVKLAAAALFVFWLTRAQNALLAVSLGFLIGGATGNALDRMIHGAVVDFVSLHALGWRWYVFNLADTAIVAGVLGLLYDALKGSVTKSPPSGST
jgi:signal peptidase II